MLLLLFPISIFLSSPVFGCGFPLSVHPWFRNPSGSCQLVQLVSLGIRSSCAFCALSRPLPTRLNGLTFVTLERFFRHPCGSVFIRGLEIPLVRTNWCNFGFSAFLCGLCVKCFCFYFRSHFSVFSGFWLWLSPPHSSVV